MPGAGAPQSLRQSDQISWAESLAGVLAQFPLAHLNVGCNHIVDAGTESFAGVLAQCTALTHLDIRWNDVGSVVGGRLRASWRGQVSGLLMETQFDTVPQFDTLLFTSKVYVNW